MAQGQSSAHTADTVVRVLAITTALRGLKSLGAILDRLLFEARALVEADAGTIFLVDGNDLVFRYVHNDSLFSADAVNRHVYLASRLPVDGMSLAGFVARKAAPLVIDDVYAMDPALPVRFNGSFDRRTGYRTRAVAALPLVSSRGRVVGVMQLINPGDAAGCPTRFTPADIDLLTLLADQATAVIEAGLVTEEFILRMARMAELRDPAETGPHVRRVGDYAAEICHTLAIRQGLSVPEAKRRKDMMRIAAMLHDVGKVGISDRILRKPGPLSAEEYHIMKRHTLLGAALFDNPSSEVDAWSRDVALHHHQRFDGTGYPGRVDDPAAHDMAASIPLAGEDITLPARITAVADVYDAVVSRRVYKPPFAEADATRIIAEGAGSQFDPAVVDAFLSIADVIAAIRSRYPD